MVATLSAIHSGEPLRDALHILRASGLDYFANNNMAAFIKTPTENDIAHMANFSEIVIYSGKRGLIVTNEDVAIIAFSDSKVESVTCEIVATGP